MASNNTQVDWEALKAIYELQWNTKFSESEAAIGNKWEGDMWLCLAYAEVYLWRVGFTDDSGVNSTCKERLTHCQGLARKLAGSAAVVDEKDREKTSSSSSSSKSSSFFSSKTSIRKTEKGELGNVNLRLAAGTIISECYFWKAFLHFRKEEQVKGGLNLHKSWKQVQANQKNVEEFLIAVERAELLSTKEGNVTSIPPTSAMPSSSAVSAEYQRIIDTCKLSSVPLDMQLMLGQHFFILGIFLYTFEQIPASLAWLAKVLGFSSSLPGGGEFYLRLSAELASSRQDWARVIVAIIDGYVLRYSLVNIYFYAYLSVSLNLSIRPSICLSISISIRIYIFLSLP